MRGAGARGGRQLSLVLGGRGHWVAGAAMAPSDVAGAGRLGLLQSQGPRQVRALEGRGEALGIRGRASRLASPKPGFTRHPGSVSYKAQVFIKISPEPS